jgi:hypothetical protein
MTKLLYRIEKKHNFINPLKKITHKLIYQPENNNEKNN